MPVKAESGRIRQKSKNPVYTKNLTRPFKNPFAPLRHCGIALNIASALKISHYDSHN
jgi:hypothetical protein